MNETRICKFCKHMKDGYKSNEFSNVFKHLNTYNRTIITCHRNPLPIEVYETHSCSFFWPADR